MGTACISILSLMVVDFGCAVSFAVVRGRLGEGGRACVLAKDVAAGDTPSSPASPRDLGEYKEMP